MIIKLTVSNFLSFGKKIELSMIQSTKIRTNKNHKIVVNNLPLLRYGIIYGANAAGKSNLIKTFSFIKRSIIKGFPYESNSLFCKSTNDFISKPSNFEIQFTINNKFYAYGFSLLLNESVVEAEWLYELNKNGSSKMIFERKINKGIIIGDKFKLSSVDDSKLKIYLDDFDNNSYKLFLNFMNNDKKYTDKSKLKIFKDIFNFIEKGLLIKNARASLGNFKYYYDDVSLNKINELIKTFDTGINYISIEEIPIEEFKKELPNKIFEDVMEDLKKKSEEEDFKNIILSMRSDFNFFNIEFNKNGEPKITTIKLKHGESAYSFTFQEESDGTRRLFDLLDMLLEDKEDKVFLIDELERSLHPKLTFRFIELFEEIHKDKRIQLIFTTHESSIMDQKLFRRDEIWFVERDSDNISNLFSLNKFKERYDKKLSKAYLDGRYGAVPVFSQDLEI